MTDKIQKIEKTVTHRLPDVMTLGTLALFLGVLLWAARQPRRHVGDNLAPVWVWWAFGVAAAVLVGIAVYALVTAARYSKQRHTTLRRRTHAMLPTQYGVTAEELAQALGADENNVRNMLLEDIESGQYTISSAWVLNADSQRLRTYHSTRDEE